MSVRSRLALRLDRLALEQLRTVASRLAQENEKLQERLAYVEHCADSWREDALALMEAECERTGGTPGIMVTGQLVVVSPPSATDAATLSALRAVSKLRELCDMALPTSEVILTVVEAADAALAHFGEST